MPSLDHLPITRRRLIQSSATAVAFASIVSPATHAQHTSGDDLVTGTTAFALALYNELRSQAEGNLIVSPYSVALALAMVYAGAEGDTATQMAEALSLETAPDDLATAFKALNADLVERGTAKADPDAGEVARGLAIANALWGEQGYPFRDAYLTELEDGFGAAMQLVDFSGAPEDARTEINDWVAEHTNDRIEDIVPPDAITEATRLVLANAIWFSGGWSLPFDPENTEDDDFRLLDGTTVSVPFMTQQAFLAHTTGEGYQAVELPYAGSKFAFTIILPDDGEFDTVEATAFESESLSTTLSGLESVEVKLSLPSFSFEYQASLVSALQALGMEDAFDSSLADFSGMVDGATDEPLVIGEVLHKAFIALDENGTEAAAATVVNMAATAMEPQEPLDVRVDRPFLFAIRDTESGALLFVGRVLDPS